MKRLRIQVLAVATACVGMVAAPLANAAPGMRGIVAPRDVALHEGGVLLGQMLDGQGTAVAGAKVTVHAAGKQVAQSVTDQTGKFRVTGLKGGVHQVVAAEQQSIYRLWAPQTAPPAAQQGLMLVSSNDLVRGQCCGSTVNCGSAVGCGSGCGCGGGIFGGGGGGVGNWMANHPLLTAGAIGAAIAIPLSLDDDDDPPATP